ncbi:Uncharacterised protein [Klebsiella pneumoniae]|nr:Uncharacterised protein [Klebsiella pneumoniae]
MQIKFRGGHSHFFVFIQTNAPCQAIYRLLCTDGFYQNLM